METRVEVVSPVIKKLFITLNPDEIKNTYESIVGDLRKQSSVPGFRKGKAPNKLIEARYRKEIEGELLRFLANDKYPEAVGAHEDDLGKVIFEEIRDFKLDKDLTVNAEFYLENMPVFDMKAIGESTLTIPKNELDMESSLEKVLVDLQQQMTRLVPVEKTHSETGDFVEVSIDGKDTTGKTLVNNEHLDIQLNDEGYWAPVAAELTGLAPDEKKSFSITYADDEKFGMLRGKDVQFDVHVLQIKEKKVPAVDDELAKGLGKFETLEDLKKDIRENLEEKHKQASIGARQQAVMTHLMETHTFEVPPSVVNQEARRITENYFRQMAQYGIPMERDEEKIRAIFEQSKGEAEQRVKESYLLSKVADKFEVVALDTEVDEILEKYLSNFGEDATLDKVRQLFEEQGEIDNVRNMVRQNKTFDLLLEKFSFEEKDIEHEHVHDATCEHNHGTTDDSPAMDAKPEE